MSRTIIIAAAIALGSLPPVFSQVPPPSPPAAKPSIAQTPAVAPPMPGQIKAQPLPPIAASTSVPPTHLNKSQPVASTSTSGQFIVHGNDLTLRSAFSSRCEEVTAEVRRLLRDQQPWVLPIVVLLTTGNAAKKAPRPVDMVVSQLTHGGFHLQLNVSLRPDLRPTELRAGIIRALLAERILRDQKEITATQRPLLLPDWLFTGIIEALDYRQRARPSALFAAIFKSGKIFGIEEIIEASPVQMDALSKTIYQTSCCALVLALLDQPEGGLRLAKFLNALATDPRPERDLLNQWFPTFAASPASLNKWWSLQLAALASPGMAEPLSPIETLKQLEAALTLRYQARPGEILAPRPLFASLIKSVPVASSPPPPTPKPAAKPKPPAPVRVATAPPAAEPKPETATPGPESVPEPTTAEEETPKRSLLSRLNPFSRKKIENDEVIAAAIEDAARAEAGTPVPTEASPSEDQAAPPGKPAHVPIKIRPIFGGGEKKPDPQPELPTEEPNAEPAKKPSNLNPLNWFRGGKKDEKKDPRAEEPPVAKDAAVSPSSPPTTFADWLPAHRPLIAHAYQVEATPEAEGKKRFFGLFGKKQPETASEPQPAESKPKREPIRIKPLFGSGKKDPEPTSEEKKEDPPAAPKSEPPAPARRPAKKTPPADNSPVAASITIEQYAAIMKSKDRAEIIKPSINALAALQNRAAVLFRPIIADYSQILVELMDGKTKDTDARLRALRSRCEKALAQSRAVRDLLDLHEANETPALSGLFEDYLKLPEIIQKELPERTDPISKYLDALDKEFSKQ